MAGSEDRAEHDPLLHDANLARHVWHQN